MGTKILRQLDETAARLVKQRAGWRCEACGRDCGPGREYQAHWAHHFGRGHKSIRWSLKNAACLCAPCHQRHTDHPAEHWAFVERLIGAEALADLRREAQRIVRWREDDLREILRALQADER